MVLVFCFVLSKVGLVGKLVRFLLVSSFMVCYLFVLINKVIWFLIFCCFCEVIKDVSFLLMVVSLLFEVFRFLVLFRNFVVVGKLFCLIVWFVWVSSVLNWLFCNCWLIVLSVCCVFLWVGFNCIIFVYVLCCLLMLFLILLMCVCL